MGAQAVTQVELVDRHGHVIPAVVTCDRDGEVAFSAELLSSVRKLRATGWSQSHIERYVRSVRCLMEYYIALGSPTLDEAGLSDLVWSYLSLRLHGSFGQGEPDSLGLYWRPSRWQTMKSECRAIADFSDYCAAAYQYLPLTNTVRVPHKREGPSHGDLVRLKKISEKSLLAHLHLLGRNSPRMAMPGRKSAACTGVGRSVMTVQQAWDVIDAERNPVYRMLWTLGFWGGPRISEQLNLWRLDVLPGACRRVLFRGDPFQDTCLVILANPWESTYCTSLGAASTARRQHLMDTFGLHPRPDLRHVEGGRYKALWSGWKGMMETNEHRRISQIFWTSREASDEYERLHACLMERQSGLGLSRKHPYLYVNLDGRNVDAIGGPLKMSNVGKAWERAVSRVGLTPYRFGASIHGMRHFYKEFVSTELGLGKKQVQLMMRHRAETSQDMYGGFNLVAIQHMLSVGRGRMLREKTDDKTS